MWKTLCLKNMNKKEYESWKNDLINGFKFASPDEAIKLLPDDIDKDIKKYLIKISKEQTPFVFGVNFNFIVNENNIKLKKIK